MMVETQVGFLVQAASILTQTESNPVQNLLRCFYLMRCREVTKGYGLPNNYFSTEVRCQRCFTNWRKGTEVKVGSLKLSKKQRRKIRNLKIYNSNKDIVQKQKEFSNKIEQMCTFCKNTTTTTSVKPSKPESNKTALIPATCNKEIIQDTGHIIKKPSGNIKNKVRSEASKKNLIQQNIKKTTVVNVYSKTKDVFSLTNKNNTLQDVVKPQKVIKNNKRKKDKFAGLCQQAVLASAKLIEEKKKENKLNLFLKPSAF